MSSRSTLSVKEAVARGLARRYRNEHIFRALGLAALLVGLGFLAFFFYTLVGNGYTASEQTRIELDVTLDAAIIDPDGTRLPETLRSADYQRVAREALGALFPDVTSRSDLRALYQLLSPGAGLELQELVVNASGGHRRDAHTVVARRRRHRRARQRPRAARRSGNGSPHRRSTARLADRARGGRAAWTCNSIAISSRAAIRAIPSSPASGAPPSARSSCCS